MDIQDRLKIVLKEKFNDSIKDFVDQTGIPRSEVEPFMKGRTELPISRWVQLSQRASVSLDWLLNGSGAMELPYPPDDESSENLPVSFSHPTKKSGKPDGISIPVLFNGQDKVQRGYVNITQPFRGTALIGVPSRDSSYPLMDALIQFEAAKGWNLCVCAHELHSLGRKLFAQFRKQQSLGLLPERALFYAVDFSDLSVTSRLNPVADCRTGNPADAMHLAQRLHYSMRQYHDLALDSGKSSLSGLSFFQTVCENYLAAVISLFVNNEVVPFDSRGRMLTQQDARSHQYINVEGLPEEPSRWRGKYADLAHILAFLSLDLKTQLDVLQQDSQAMLFMAPFHISGTETVRFGSRQAFVDQFDGITLQFRNFVRTLLTPEVCWVLSGDEVCLGGPRSMDPCYAYFAPCRQSDVPARIFSNFLMNQILEQEGGLRGNGPCGVLVENAVQTPVHKLDVLFGTAYSCRTALALGVPSKALFDDTYGFETSEAILKCMNNLVCTPWMDIATAKWVTHHCVGRFKVDVSVSPEGHSSDTSSDAAQSVSSSLPQTDPESGIPGEQSLSGGRKDKHPFRYVDLAQCVRSMGEEWMAGQVSRHSTEMTPFLAKMDTCSKLWSSEELPLPEVSSVGSTPEERLELLRANERRIVEDVDHFCSMFLARAGFRSLL